MSNGIYKFENLINHKVYIGQSIDLEKRYKKHLKNIKDPSKNTLLYKALRKYGIENFSFSILESFEDFNQDRLNKLEIDYINKYNSIMPNGYNMIPGGSNGAGLAKGKIVLQYDMQGKFIAEYSSAHQAENETGCDFGSICACCRGKIVHVKGFQWRYKNNFFPVKKLKSEEIIIMQRKILQYSLDGVLIQTFDSIKDAALAVNCSKALLTNVCRHKGWTGRGYFWCFEDDTERLNEFLKRQKQKQKNK